MYNLQLFLNENDKGYLTSQLVCTKGTVQLVVGDEKTTITMV